MFRNAVRHFSRYANNQIFLHDVSGRYAATLWESANAVPIGHSPCKSVLPETFRANPEFVLILNSVIRKSIDSDFTFIMEAGVSALTYMPIYDFREVPRYGRTPSPDNVFGYVLVDENGKMVPDSYEANNLYRVCNNSGLITMSDYLLEQMRAATKP